MPRGRISFLPLGLVAFLAATTLNLFTVSGAHATIKVDTLYARLPLLGPQVDWQVPSGAVIGRPDDDCNTNINPHYASNDIGASNEYLGAGNWSPYTLPSGFV